MTKKRVVRSLSIELYEGDYYVNNVSFVNLDAALEYAKTKLPTIPKVAIYTTRTRKKVYMHEKKPVSVYNVVSERLSPEEAWDLFVGHVGMLQ